MRENVGKDELFETVTDRVGVGLGGGVTVGVTERLALGRVLLKVPLGLDERDPLTVGFDILNDNVGLRVLV